MNKYQPQTGRVCKSLAGRDAGKHFIIFEVVDCEYVRIVDGKTHRIASPKKKKLKHLILMETVMETIAEKIVARAILHDPEINSSLRAFN